MEFLCQNSVVVFTVWTLSSFICHQSGKVFLQQGQILALGDDDKKSVPVLVALASVLTGIQSLFCVMTFRFNDNTKTAEFPKRLVCWIVVSHCLTTLLTNISMAVADASTTFAVKLAEPIWMVFANHMILKTPVTKEAVISLPIFVCGAILFTGSFPTFTTSGVNFAFLSSAFLTIRNLSLKKLHSIFTKITIPSKLAIQTEVVFVLVGLGTLGLLTKYDVLNSTILLVVLLCLVSGSCHVMHTYLSTNVVLKEMNVVHHSVANVVKRLSVVLLLYCFGDRHASSLNFLGLFMCGIGLIICFKENLAFVGNNKIGKICQHFVLKKTLLLTFMMSTGFLAWIYISRRHMFLLQARKIVSKHSVPTRTWTPQYQDLDWTTVYTQNTGFETSSSQNLSLYEDHKKRWTVTRKRYENISREMDFKEYPVDGKSKALQLSDTTIVSVGKENNNSSPKQNNFRLHGKDAEQQFINYSEFFNWSLVEHPSQTNLVAPKLTSNTDVVTETQRVLLNLLGHLTRTADHVMLLETAIYENKGDPAITAGEAILLAQLNKTVVYQCSTYKCTKRNLDHALRLSTKYRHEELVILMQGGGNMVLYPFQDHIRENIIRRFSRFKMIILSQSVWVNPRNKNRLYQCQKIYSYNSNLTILVREKQSYDLVQKYFKGTSVILAPDMAFSIGVVPRTLPPTFDILWLRRQDRESSNYVLPPLPRDLRVHVEDWIQWKSNKGTSDMETSFIMAYNGLTFLQRGRVVITDRLHGHILSVLLNIPHVIIDNPPARKLSYFHESWTAGLNNTVLVTDGNKALVEARKLLDKFADKIPSVGQYMLVP